MTEQTLLIVLIAILTISWVSIAVVAILIGMRVLRVLHEVEGLVVRLREAGEAAAADVEQLRERIKEEGSKLRGVIDFVLALVMRKVTAPKRRVKKPVAEEVGETE